MYNSNLLYSSNFKKFAIYLALLFVIILFYPYYESVGMFAGLGLYFSVLVLLNMGTMLYGQVSLPYLMVFNYFLQHLLAALVLYIYPPLPLYDIGHDRYSFYLSFAVPCCIALFLGAVLATKKAKGIPFNPDTVNNNFPAWACYAKHLYWIGLLSYFATSSLSSFPVLSFLFVLASSLRFVGLFTLILAGDKKWWLYALILFWLEIASSVATGFFHDLILWSGSLFLVLSYRYRWRTMSILTLVLAMIFLILFQSVKGQYRQLVSQEEKSVVQKISLLTDMMTSQMNSADTLFDPTIMAATLVRFNQGWIVNKVMRRVPDVEPYAHGNTIVKGLYAAFIPRVIDPDKPVAGGRENFEKYTGLQLSRETAMNIGVTGEMYANFGLYGGVIGMAVYGYLIGLLYLLLYNKALENPVWWAWGPFVGFMAMKAEEGLMETITWIVKSLIIMVAIIIICKKIKKTAVITV